MRDSTGWPLRCANSWAVLEFAADQSTDFTLDEFPTTTMRIRKYRDGKSIAALMMAALALISSACAASDWISLIHGKTLENWVVRGGTAQYRIENDIIVGTTVDSRDPGTQTFLCTRREYADFELELDVLCDKELNSGIQIRSHVYEQDTPTPKRPRHKGEVYGYQCEIANSERCTSGNFQDEARGYIWYDDLNKRPGACAAFKDNQWNHYRIVAQGDHIRSWVNGVACADFHDNKDASGLIGLQVHTIKFGTGPFQVRFKNIKIRELSPRQTVE